MLGALLSLTVATLAQPADTTLDLRRGDRVVVEGLSGDLSVSSWDRDAIEIVTDGDERLSVRRRGSEVRIGGGETGRRRRGRGPSVDARVRVPRWVELQVGGRSLDVSIRGVDGGIRVGSLSGDIRVEDTTGDVDVQSISGEIEVTDARGAVRATSQADDVTLRRVSGPVEVQSGDGDILLDEVTSRSVRAEAQDGDVHFDGTLVAGGDYGFFLHDGDATISVPESTGAHVSVSTFDGEFRSDFKVTVERFTSGRHFEFDLGDGGARVQVEVFDGDIRLLQRR